MLAFLLQNLPTVKEVLVGGPAFLLFAYLSLRLAGQLKLQRSLKTGYTRKVFHFLIFAGAAAVQALAGLPLLFLFGSMVSAVIFVALLRGDGHVLYEGIAREKDAPHRTYFILIPYFATLFGGLASNYWFHDAALIGYLVTGLGDAIAEPVGTRFGRHEYTVPSFRGVKSRRSLEGSLAVFAASFAALALGLWLITGTLDFSLQKILLAAEFAFLCAITEAVSPHGWDNFSMQIVPAFLGLQFFL